MKLVDMSITPEEAQEEASPSPSDGDKPAYPYGLRLRLEADTLDKLGIEGEAEVGAPCTIQAEGEVISYSMNKGQDGQEYCCVEIQITKLGIDGVEEEDEESPAAKVYGKSPSSRRDSTAVGRAPGQSSSRKPVKVQESP